MRGRLTVSPSHRPEPEAERRASITPRSRSIRLPVPHLSHTSPPPPPLSPAERGILHGDESGLDPADHKDSLDENLGGPLKLQGKKVI